MICDWILSLNGTTWWNQRPFADGIKQQSFALLSFLWPGANDRLARSAINRSILCCCCCCCRCSCCRCWSIHSCYYCCCCSVAILLLLLLMLLILNYDESIDAASMLLLLIDAADQFFLAVSNAKWIEVPPLLRTESTTRLLQHCKHWFHFHLSNVKLVGSID